MRLLGINTPERGKPGAAEATAFVKAWMTAASQVEVSACGRDSFGRLLGEVTERRSGRNLGQELLGAKLRGAVPEGAVSAVGRV